MAVGRFGRVGFLAFALMATASVVSAECPNGSYPTYDSWGNAICRPNDSQGQTTIQGSLDQCPNGTYPTYDNMGNRVCRQSNSGYGTPPQDYYDTSKGCPVGTYQTYDSAGNTVCRR